MESNKYLGAFYAFFASGWLTSEYRNNLIVYFGAKTFFIWLGSLPVLVLSLGFVFDLATVISKILIVDKEIVG